MSKPRGVLQKFSTSCIQYTYHGTNEYLSTTYSLSFLVCVGDVLVVLNLIWDLYMLLVHVTEGTTIL